MTYDSWWCSNCPQNSGAISDVSPLQPDTYEEHCIHPVNFSIGHQLAQVLMWTIVLVRSTSCFIHSAILDSHPWRTPGGSQWQKYILQMYQSLPHCPSHPVHFHSPQNSPQFRSNNHQLCISSRILAIGNYLDSSKQSLQSVLTFNFPHFHKK